MSRHLKLLALCASLVGIALSAALADGKEQVQQAIGGVSIDADFPQDLVPVLVAEKPKWGLFENGGYWRTVPAGPLEIFDIRAKWIPDGADKGTIEVKSRQRVFKEGKWDHMGKDEDTPQKLHVEKRSGKWQTVMRSGDTTLDMLMIPNGIGAVAIQFGSDGIFWKDAQGNTYRPGEALPRTPPLAEIQAACTTADPKRDEFRKPVPAKK